MRKTENFSSTQDLKGPPGPGTYRPRPATSTAPKYSVAGKPSDPHIEKIPGPGTYKGQNFMNSMKSKASIVIGNGPKTQKDLTTLKDVPGPGSYRPFVESPHGSAVIGGEDRLPPNRTSAMIVPGPGAYKIKAQITPIGAVMAQAVRF